MLEVDIEKIIPVNEARDNLESLAAQVAASDDLFVLTQNGKPEAILVGVHHLETLTGMPGADLIPPEANDIGPNVFDSMGEDTNTQAAAPTTQSDGTFLPPATSDNTQPIPAAPIPAIPPTPVPAAEAPATTTATGVNPTTDVPLSQSFPAEKSINDDLKSDDIFAPLPPENTATTAMPNLAAEIELPATPAQAAPVVSSAPNPTPAPTIPTSPTPAPTPTPTNTGFPTPPAAQNTMQQ
ncbi:MAG: type II toxin-antitoxin system Phd/YefM family antitoxin [Candidatus Berkelbacteria bacterium]|nr:type II toxin-antitoxin system Phd/YefM family antitoxin [Candidatus Berkelbacteria bacterium]